MSKNNFVCERVRRAPLHASLLSGVSLLAITIGASPALAQSTSTSTATNSDQVETVVVTARRQAIGSAQERKKDADQIVDSVVADEAGKLPDNSITEVLQRIPGVTITRFAAPNDPDHYSIEGSGVAVRGLTQVNSTLNGREDFSANGGRALLWQDVSPELMAAVDVYKSSTPDQIEGGIGGSVDLRTHMPFDFQDFTLNGSVGTNYGDFVKQGRPSASVLVSDRWKTGIGEMGLLVDLAYSDLSSRYDTIQVEPYNQQTLYNGANAFVPGGFDWRTSGYDRKRVGVYEAFQWKPVPRLSLFQTFFQSYYNQYQFGVAAYNANGTSETVANGSPYTLNSSGGLTEADSIVFTGWNPVPCPASSPQCSVATTDTGTSISNFRTSDLTEGFTWDATDRLYVNGALQYVHSTSNYEGLDAFPYTVVPSFGFSISGGNPPSISVPNSAVLSVPANYFWEAAEDHFEQHAGQQLSFNTDAKYEVSDSDFLRSIKVGVRIADLREKDDVSAYNWQALTPPWDPQNTWNYLNTAPPGDVMIEQFSNFFKGQVPLPGAIVAPSFALINTFNAGLLHQMFGEPGDTVGRVPYYPYDLTLSRTRSRAVYLMASFGDDGFFGMPMNGNIGIRVVNYENESSGYASLNSTTILNNGVVVGTIPSTQIAPNSGGISYVRVLPAFNVQFLPTDDIHVRVAASQSLTNPSFNQMSASGGISFTSCPADAGGAGGGGFDVHCTSYAPGTAPLTGYGGDPKLKPQISNNVDLSLEWYGTNQSAAHIGAFYKSIDDYLEYGTFQSTNVTLTLPGGTYTFPFQMTNYFNTSQPATVEGFETGATKFFDFLPDPFDGIGIDANFTYIQSSSPGDQSCFLFPAHVTPAPGAPCGASQPIHGLPVEQLSKYNYNLTAMYEKGPVSLRLAYNWRSKYLLVASGANGTGTLPVFGASYGQLDFGASYKINEHVTLSLDGQNMTDSMNKTLMGYQDSVYGNQQYGRSWFISDRRFVGTLKFSF